MTVTVLLWALALFAAHGVHAAGMGAEDARHLLARSGFSPSPAEIHQYAALSREQAVEQLLAGVLGRPVTAWPDELDRLPDVRKLRAMSEPERRAFNRQERARGIELRSWWLGEMLHTPSPLTERMTMFWHNHFVSSQDKVRLQKLMLQQNLTLREHALGNFGHLLVAASKDPAMVIYLDARSSKKGQPNENFAREVMELFTLGEGHYSERDIKEAARAFTGWDVDRRSGQFVFRRANHDAGEKEIFGQRGRFDGDDVLRLILARPETAEFITTKLWREFVSQQPDAREVRRIAAQLRQANYEIKPALRAMFLSQAFWAPETRGALVKSPVELVVGTLRSLDADVPDAIPFVRTLHQMGQDLFAPPNVRGWPGGEWWINSASLLDRKQFLDRLARADDPRRQAAMARPAITQEMAPGRAPQANPAQDAIRRRAAEALRNMDIDLQAWLDETKRLGMAPEKVLLAVAPVDANAMSQGREQVRALLLDPAYQLK